MDNRKKQKWWDLLWTMKYLFPSSSSSNNNNLLICEGFDLEEVGKENMRKKRNFRYLLSITFQRPMWILSNVKREIEDSHAHSFIIVEIKKTRQLNVNGFILKIWKSTRPWISSPLPSFVTNTTIFKIPWVPIFTS